MKNEKRKCLLKKKKKKLSVCFLIIPKNQFLFTEERDNLTIKQNNESNDFFEKTR